MNEIKGKESWSCIGVAMLLTPLLDNVDGEQFVQVLCAIVILTVVGAVTRLVSKWGIENEKTPKQEL